MKMRRLSLVLVLVLLAALLLVVPVQAGRTVTAFVHVPVHLIGVVFADESWTGPVLHGHYVIKAWVDGGPKLAGELTWTCQEVSVTPNPHDPNGFWGTAPGTWKIIISAPGQPLSGWEGTVSHPPAKQGHENLYARGNGFGMYKNMHIEWAIIDGMTLFTDPYYTAWMSGQYSENAK